MKITNQDCITMMRGLKGLKQPSLADIKGFKDKEDYMFHTKFAHTVSKNKRDLTPILELIEETDKPSEEYEEYVKARDELFTEMAEKKKDGNPDVSVANNPNGSQSKTYNVPSLADKNSRESKKLKSLEAKHKDAIDAREKQNEEVKEFLKEDSKFVPAKVRWSMIPKGLETEQMDAVFFMIEDGTEEEEKPTKKKKNEPPTE